MKYTRVTTDCGETVETQKLLCTLLPVCRSVRAIHSTAKSWDHTQLRVDDRQQRCKNLHRSHLFKEVTRHSDTRNKNLMWESDIAIWCNFYMGPKGDSMILYVDDPFPINSYKFQVSNFPLSFGELQIFQCCEETWVKPGEAICARINAPNIQGLNGQRPESMMKSVGFRKSLKISILYTTHYYILKVSKP